MAKRKSSRSSSRSSRSGRRSSQTLLIIRTLILILLVFAAIYYLDIDLKDLRDLLPDQPGAPGEVVRETTGGSGDWYDIYFTGGACPPAQPRQGGIDELIAADIRQAQRQVDVAAFELESPAMAQALLERQGQGVRVRVVTDSDNIDRPTIGELRQAGLTVVEDQRSSFMHNKFVVIDEQIVWTGSMNFTPNDVYCNNNNMVRLQSSRLATNYTAEMDEKYEQGRFGPTSPDATPHEQLLINEIRVENYFGPEKRIAPIIAERVNSAQRELLFMAFSFTHLDIGEAILARAQAGVTIRGVFETTGSQTDFSYFPPLRNAGLANLQVRQDGNPRTMHHKVIIIDRTTVIFGSFNFTANANDRNDENVVIIHDPTFAGYFVEEFEAVWSQAKP
jgi:phosphatidylserine/phosphatidylglycerophosphate/cardiolipin synthase-like enzyme